MGVTGTQQQDNNWGRVIQRKTVLVLDCEVLRVKKGNRNCGRWRWRLRRRNSVGGSLKRPLKSNLLGASSVHTSSMYNMYIHTLTFGFIYAFFSLNFFLWVCVIWLKLVILILLPRSTTLFVSIFLWVCHTWLEFVIWSCSREGENWYCIQTSFVHMHAFLSEFLFMGLQYMIEIGDFDLTSTKYYYIHFIFCLFMYPMFSQFFFWVALFDWNWWFWSYSREVPLIYYIYTSFVWLCIPFSVFFMGVP